MMKNRVVLFTFLLGFSFLPAMGGDRPATAVSSLQLPPDRGRQLAADIDLKLARIDRSQFDIQALLDKMSYDEEQVIGFVRDDIAFEDYTGVLRGAEGTLKSRAGNSLDQAILLARLLKEIGLDARIAEGAVPSAMLSGLVLQKRTPPELFQASAGRGSPGGIAHAAGDFVLPQEVTDTATVLVKTLRDHGIDMKSAPGGDPEQQAAYFWVEYRATASGPWVSAHPVFRAEHTPPGAIEPVRYFADSIPAELQQRISIQAFIERSWNGKREKIAVTTPYEYPASNLSGLTFSYSVVPNVDLTAAKGDRGEAERLIGGANLFFPMVNFGSPASGLAFDTAGNTLSAEAASSDKAAIFQTVGRRFGEVADALAAESTVKPANEKPSRYVTRHWLEIVFKRPGQAPRTITRDIARWEEDEAAFKLSVARTVYFRVETGAVSPAEFLDRNLRGLKESIDSLVRGNALQQAGSPAAQFSLDAEVFLFVSDMVARRNKDGIGYRGEPTIVARYHPFGRVDERREGFDIVASPRHVISTAGGHRDRAGALLSGVTDTWLEYRLLAGETWQQDSAFEKLHSRMPSYGLMNLLSEKDRADIDPIPGPGREFIRQDLDSGELVLFPGEASTCDSWWRVDPVTGNTLGMLGNGWGGVETTEYVTNLTIIYGKSKVAVALASCSTVIAFIKASAFMNAWSLFKLDEAVGFQGYDICSQMPSPDLQSLCTVVMAAASVAGEAGLEGVSTETLKYICLKAIF